MSGIRTWNWLESKILITGTKPKNYKPRLVLYIPRTKIGQEFKRLQQGTIPLVNFSEWATPIVSIDRIKLFGFVEITW